MHGVVRLLVERGAAVNHVSITGHTELMFASIKGSEECASILCAHGAHRMARKFELGLSAADYARKLRHPPPAAWLDGSLTSLLKQSTHEGIL